MNSTARFLVPGLLLIWLTAAHGYLLRPAFAGHPLLLSSLALAWAPVLLYATWELIKQGTWRAWLTLRPGDLTQGALLGALLLLASWLGRTTLTEVGSGREAWLYLVYLQVGEPDAIQQSLLQTLLLFFIVFCEESALRGLFYTRAEELVGTRHAWICSALLSALIVSPTLFTLAAPGVGANPLVFLLALFLGLVLGFLRRWVPRLPPLFIAHAVFSYFSLTQFHLPGL